MQFEMCCPRCFRRFAAPPEAARDEILEQVFPDARGYALGDGETFEDMISTALAEHTATLCPACGGRLQFSEESLGRLAMTMLARM
jgi:hypothetical protein